MKTNLENIIVYVENQSIENIDNQWKYQWKMKNENNVYYDNRESVA